VIFDYDVFLLGFLLSRMHNVWVKAVSGRLGTGISYSPQICYNTFPFPDIDTSNKKHIAALTEKIILVREDYPGKTLSELYDPDHMPDPLRKAHEELDLAVEKIFRDKPFADDSERLDYLFRLYEQLIAKENKGA